MKAHISTDPLPPFKVAGRYVCDWKLTEAHIFDNAKDARKFASEWGRDCNIGWLSPVYDKGRNRKPYSWECKREIAKTVTITDHRRQSVAPADR